MDKATIEKMRTCRVLLEAPAPEIIGELLTEIERAYKALKEVIRECNVTLDYRNDAPSVIFYDDSDHAIDDMPTFGQFMREFQLENALEKVLERES